MDESTDQLIHKYMNSSEDFRQDFRQFKEKLENGDKKEPIVVFSHKLDITSFKNKNNLSDPFIEKMLKNKESISESFEKRLKRFQTEDKKIWFFLKYKNLSENRNLKTSDQMKENTKKLVSVDCLQIVALSEALKHAIGRKYVSQVDGSEKWSLRRLREMNFKKLSDNFKEVKDKRVYTKKRYILANIGSKDTNKCLTPIRVTLFLETLDQKEVNGLYIGSHLESVVLLQIESSEYVLLSFDKVFRPVPQLIDDFSQYLSQFPDEFQKLFRDRKKSNYSFALSLAFVFGDNMSLSGSFFRLKLGLMLSLLSIHEYPKRNHSSVLVLCDDTLMIRRLFEWSSLLSEYRYFYKSLSVPISGQSREDKQGFDWIDAGALQLGADGITIIGSVSNLNELPEKERTALFHSLETNEVIARKSQPSEPSLKELNLKSTIWAVIEDNIDERQYQQKSNRSQTILWPQVFGMVYRVQDLTNDYIYTPTPSAQQMVKPTVDLNDWQKVFELMGGIRPQMTDMAETLLKNYYVANRRIRGSKLNHISFETLISLSKSMAKLSLRLEVTKYDALMAILLFEESLITRLGETQSRLSVDPIYHIPDVFEVMMEYIGLESDRRMDAFEQKLMEFLANEAKNSKSNLFNEYFSENEE